MTKSNVLGLRNGEKRLTLYVERTRNRFKVVVEIDGEQTEFPVKARELGRLAERLMDATDGYR